MLLLCPMLSYGQQQIECWQLQENK